MPDRQIFDPKWIKTFDEEPKSNLIHMGVDHGKPGADKTVQVGWTIESDGTVRIGWIKDDS